VTLLSGLPSFLAIAATLLWGAVTFFTALGWATWLERIAGGER